MVMDSLMRQQYANAQTAFARRQQGLQSATPQIPPAAAWTLHPAGQQAPREHYNFEPQGNGAWRIYPPGVAAPPHAPQGSHPEMPTDYADLRALGNDIHRQTRSGPPPGVPGPFSMVGPQPAPRPQRPAGGIAGIV